MTKSWGAYDRHRHARIDARRRGRRPTQGTAAAPLSMRAYRSADLPPAAWALDGGAFREAVARAALEARTGGAAPKGCARAALWLRSVLSAAIGLLLRRTARASPS